MRATSGSVLLWQRLCPGLCPLRQTAKDYSLRSSEGSCSRHLAAPGAGWAVGCCQGERRAGPQGQAVPSWAGWQPAELGLMAWGLLSRSGLGAGQAFPEINLHLPHKLFTFPRLILAILFLFPSLLMLSDEALTAVSTAGN